MLTNNKQTNEPTKTQNTKQTINTSKQTNSNRSQASDWSREAEGSQCAVRCSPEGFAWSRFVFLYSLYLLCFVINVFTLNRRAARQTVWVNMPNHKWPDGELAAVLSINSTLTGLSKCCVSFCYCFVWFSTKNETNIRKQTGGNGAIVYHRLPKGYRNPFPIEYIEELNILVCSISLSLVCFRCFLFVCCLLIFLEVCCLVLLSECLHRLSLFAHHPIS